MRYLMLLWGLLSFGCAVDANGPMEEEEPASTTEALNNWVDGPYRWSQGQSDKAILPFSTHLCVMTRVTGHFAGLGESFKVWHTSDFWYMGGSSAQSGVGGEVYCFRRSGLTNPNGTAAVSDSFSALQGGGGVRHRCFGTTTTGVWGFDSAITLAGIAGKFEGGGERARVTQVFDGLSSNSVSAEMCTEAPLWASAYAIAFKAGRPIRFIDGALQPKFDDYSVAGDNGAVAMAPVGNSFCYFTSISGAFHGGGEFAQIRPERIGALDYWVLRGGSQAGGMSLRARCVARNQS